MKSVVLIPTYQRPEMLKSLIASIGNKADVKTFEDENPHRGKEGFWMLVNDMFSFVKSTDYDYYFIIGDDFSICENFFEKAINTYDSIEDKYKICLSLYMPKGRENKPNWTGLKPQLKRFKDKTVLRTQWNDLCFVATKDFFIALDYYITPISKARWVNNPNISSGVGQQISLRLNSLGFNMYHVLENLASHGDHPSLMNDIERKINPLL